MKIDWQFASNAEKREALKYLDERTINDIKLLKETFDAKVITLEIKNNEKR